MSAAASLAALPVFSATGITLNYASQIEAEPRVVNTIDELPASGLRLLGGEHGEAGPLPPSVARRLSREMDIHAGGHGVEWPADEVYVSLPRPGCYPWPSFDRTTREFEYERTDP